MLVRAHDLKRCFGAPFRLDSGPCSQNSVVPLVEWSFFCSLEPVRKIYVSICSEELAYFARALTHRTSVEFRSCVLCSDKINAFVCPIPMRPLRSRAEIDRYITAIHEAAHAFVAHKSEFFEIKEPAIRFPGGGSGYLALAHLGPKIYQPGLEKRHAREMVKIGYAGFHGQNLLDKLTLLTVLDTPEAGCGDDFIKIKNVAMQTSITDELQSLFQESQKIVADNEDTIHALADVIYESKGNVPRADLLAVLKPAPKGFFGRIGALFGKP